MSITFYPELGVHRGFDLECECRYRHTERYPPFASSADAELALLTLEEKGESVCGSSACSYGFVQAFYENSDLPQLNVTNHNSVSIFDALGLIPEGASFHDYCSGSLDANDFLGRVLMALAVAPVSPERVTEEHTSEVGPRVVIFGRPEGYLQGKLIELQRVAESARERGVPVVWA